jgi:hypothetical protein
MPRSRATLRGQSKGRRRCRVKATDVLMTMPSCRREAPWSVTFGRRVFQKVLECSSSIENLHGREDDRIEVLASKGVM